MGAMEKDLDNVLVFSYPLFPEGFVVQQMLITDEKTKSGLYFHLSILDSSVISN
jgi:hypothetical protein